MMPIFALSLITEALKLVNLLLEGTPVEQRRAQSIAWFWATWPIAKPILKLAGTPAEAVTGIEEQMRLLSKIEVKDA